MTKPDEVKALRDKVAAGLKTARSVRDWTRTRTEALKTDPLILTRWSEEGRHEEEQSLRQEALAKVRPLAEAAAAAREMVKGLGSGQVRADYLREARHVPVPPKLPAHMVEAEHLMFAALSQMAEDTRALRLAAELRAASSEELAHMAKRAVVGGTESDAARLREIQRELRDRTDEAAPVARAQVADAVGRFPIPEADAAAVTMASQIAAMADAVESAYRELQNPQHLDVTDRVEANREDSEGFIKGLPAEHAQHAHDVHAAAVRMTKRAVLDDFEAEVKGGEGNGSGF